MIFTRAQICFVLALSLPTAVAHGGSCRDQMNAILSGQLDTQNTDQLTAYLERLLENQTLSETHIAQLLSEIESGRITNPISEDAAETNARLLIHREGIQRIIQSRALDLNRLREWAQGYLVRKSQVDIERDETRAETQNSFQKIEFHKIPAGSFRAAGETKKINITLTHDFEVMSTLVTQKQWVDLMGANPARFNSGEDEIATQVNGKSVKLVPDRPVESVTWYSALVYANKLSELHGLKPVYDFSDAVLWPQTSAEDGTLQLRSGKVRINAPQGNIYEAEGYRLPTQAEQEYMLYSAELSPGAYRFADDREFYAAETESELDAFAWSDRNSGGTTHPVAKLKPLIVAGKPIYDLLGNVWQWSHDWSFDYTVSPKNPVGELSSSQKATRGGAWNSYATSFRKSAGKWFPDLAKTHEVGFRLVRSK